MFNIFKRSRLNTNAGMVNAEHRAPLKLKLDFLECTDLEESESETVDNDLIILPSDGLFVIENAKEADNVTEKKDIKSGAPAHPEEKIEFNVDEFNVTEFLKNVDDFQKSVEINSLENHPFFPVPNETPKINGADDIGADEYEEQVSHPPISELESGDAKNDSRYNDVLPQILDLARGDPANYGCEKHSLRKLRTFLFEKGIVKISHETLRTLLADNGIKWNGNDCHKPKKKPKEKIVIIDRHVPPSLHAQATHASINEKTEIKEPEPAAKIEVIEKAEPIQKPEQPSFTKPPLVNTDIPAEKEIAQQGPTAKEIELEANVREIKAELDGIKTGISEIKAAQDRRDDQSQTLIKSSEIVEKKKNNVQHGIDTESMIENGSKKGTGDTLVVKSYGTFILNDYVKNRIMIQETDAHSAVSSAVINGREKPEESEKILSGASGSQSDIYVPPCIKSEMNNIKSFGADFDPTKLNVIDSYSLPNPIESPTVYIVKDGYKLRYLIKEPVKPATYGSVRDAILRNVDLYKSAEEDPVARLDAIVNRLKKKYPELAELRVDEERALRYYLFRDFIGYREIDVPMNDDNIEDITCVGYGIPVFIYHQKYYNLVSDIVMHERELDAMVLRLAQEGGKHISISDPIVDATLRNGTRAQLTFKKTATEKGSTFTLRRFRNSHITPVDLIEKGTYSLEAMAYLWHCVQSGKSIIIAGGTATGKTTNLNACSLFIPPEVKIVSIEDTREIKLYQKNWIPSTTTKDIDTFGLLKAALRQRPEYIIVGEVRGKEAQTLFQAMTSGHVVMSTFHAGSVDDLVNRLTSSPIDVPAAMLESLDIIIVLKNEWTNASSRHRYADAIYEQQKIKGVPRFVKIYDHEEGLSASLITHEIKNKIDCLSSLMEEGIRNPDKVSERVISQMYAAGEQ